MKSKFIVLACAGVVLAVASPAAAQSENSRIIDEGSFEQLMANSVAFKTMWDHQNGRSFVAA